MSAKVLVIEDEPDIRMLAHVMLQSAGHQVVEAHSGEEGLELADREHPNLVLLDIRLPGIDGWEVLRKLRERADGAGVPVVMMSAHSSGHTLRKAQDAGSDGYLVKPFKQQDLLDFVNRFDPAS